MLPRRAILLASALTFATLFALTVWNPNDFLTPGLRDNFVSDFFTATLSALIFDQALDAIDRHRTRKERDEKARAGIQTLDHDVHALWSLLVPVRPREDPLRRDSPEKRVELFLRDLADAKTWAEAPAGHAVAARERVRDLGEDADEMGFHELREAARAMDEDWETLPRSQLSQRFATEVAPRIDDALRRLAAPPDDD